MERFKDSQTWYVVFDTSTSGNWWTRLLKKEFRHVLLWREIEGGCICINPLAHVFAVQYYANAKLDDMIRQELEQGCTAILSQTVHYSSFYHIQPIEPFTCVTVAKRMLGIRKRIITPFALYREMVKMGATIIKPFTITIY